MSEDVKASTAIVNPNEPGSTWLKLSWIWQTAGSHHWELLMGQTNCSVASLDTSDEGPASIPKKLILLYFLMVEMHYRMSTRGTRTVWHEYGTLQHYMAHCEAQSQLDLPLSLC